MDAQQPLAVPDSSYRMCWHKFVAFVDQHRGGPTPSPSRTIEWYLSRDIIDLFFEQVIPILNVNPDGVGCYKSTLQWYADKVEYMEERLEEGEQSLDVDSCKVQKALHNMLMYI